MQLTSPSPALELRHVSKAFGHVVALDDVSLRFERGEVSVIVGDNGAGKSTMMKVLSGVYPVDSGELCIDGKPTYMANPATARAHGIAAVFQNLALVECLDVAENMYLGRQLRKWGIFADKKAMIDGAADTLTELKVRLPSVRVPVGILSGGQRQGIAIARAVQQNTPIVLLDEPTAALGYRETQQVITIIRQLREAGKAVVLVSHDLSMVFDVADTIQVMRLGRVQGVRRRAVADRNEIIGLITGAIDSDRRAA
ncbi:ATP-binding cassette domain-containing protein [Kaistia algarum]|uniref:ATP-binding cassette domain-containing protein n=1 Tax=Kaistia algarum TaxID=2083279 RepID=UPI001A9C3152|nr:ATP-binding cassette domain-containing protein [Kaistia algarum]MCX5515774.1 ATP-binding cassette domain-containing protein [Kaistia algarum]